MGPGAALATLGERILLVKKNTLPIVVPELDHHNTLCPNLWTG
jgi:hypothetical protein